jgi:hypothetical protein
MAEEIGKEIYGIPGIGEEIAKYEIDNKKSYIDNFIFFPMSSNVAVLLVHPIWKNLLLYPDKMIHSEMPFRSNILNSHLSIPKTKYVNEDKIKESMNFLKQKHPEDKYQYQIHKMTEAETQWLNHITINEACRFVGLVTVS